MLAAMAVNGDVSKGAEVAKNATAYNRQLHPEEQRQIREKAKELEAQYGKIDLGGLTWSEMLTLAAGDSLDKAHSDAYLALLKELNNGNPDNPIKARFDDIREIAHSNVALMGIDSKPLLSASGEVIYAHGQPVYAFQATPEQFADSNLFNGPYYDDSPGAAWNNLLRAIEQNASGKAGNPAADFTQYQGQQELQQDIRTALGLAIGDGIQTSYPEDYFPPAGAAKGAAMGVGKVVKEVGGAVAGKVEAKLAESAAAQAVVSKATDPLKVLPAPRQIEASWGANTYKHGGLMTGIEHIFYRHGPDSGFSNTGKYSAGTAVKDVSSYVDNALRYGKVTPNGPGGYVVEYNVGKTIGVDLYGKPTSILQVNVRDGVIHTAFPK